jgi:NAD+ diphosphatase
MLVQSPCGQHCLLGRKSAWPVGRFSALAGFLEVGETLEQAVMRETFEESGVVIDPQSVTYRYSQPWPFPSSLMLGFTASAMSNEGSLPDIAFDAQEMEDVQWFSKSDVQLALRRTGSTSLVGWQPSDKEKELHFPGKSSLARKLLTDWAAEV